MAAYPGFGMRTPAENPDNYTWGDLWQDAGALPCSSIQKNMPGPVKGDLVILRDGSEGIYTGDAANPVVARHGSSYSGVTLPPHPKDSKRSIPITTTTAKPSGTVSTMGGIPRWMIPSLAQAQLSSSSHGNPCAEVIAEGPNLPPPPGVIWFTHGEQQIAGVPVQNLRIATEEGPFDRGSRYKELVGKPLPIPVKVWCVLPLKCSRSHIVLSQRKMNRNTDSVCVYKKGDVVDVTNVVVVAQERATFLQCKSVIVTDVYFNQAQMNHYVAAETQGEYTVSVI